jgi:hypothetical protein
MDDPPVDALPETDATPPVADPPTTPDAPPVPEELPIPTPEPPPQAPPDPTWCEYQPPSYDTPLPVEEHGRYWFSGSQHPIPASQLADLLKLPGFRKVSRHV